MTTKMISKKLTKDLKRLVWMNTLIITVAISLFSSFYLNNIALTTGVLLLGFVVGILNHFFLDGYYRAKAEKTLNQSYETMKEDFSFDELTQVYNRKAGTEKLEEAFERRQESRKDISLAIVDADNFKMVNDSYGHQAGDHVLRIIAKTIQHQIRTHDIVFRYGGEEFLIIMPNTSEEEASIPLERLRENLASMVITYEGKQIKTSVSIGVSATLEIDEKADDVISRADQALYRAKNSGKNRVVYHNNITFTPVALAN
ncbi:MAG: GGDEF domain-containing protein [Thermodesulfobacteriota bacterium]